MRVEIASTLSVIRGRNRIFSGRHDALTQVLTRERGGKGSTDLGNVLDLSSFLIKLQNCLAE